MNNEMSKFVQIDDWIFEVKMVRAIRVKTYGKPYNAIANFNINGENAYIDGLMTGEDDSFSNEDCQTFVKFSQKLGLKQLNFDRFKNQKMKSVTINLPQLNEGGAELRLVK